MLSYQHIYHAGNFADVHKHAILTLLIEYLKKKPAPFFILDAHGGRGLYPLDAPEAEKTSEYMTGIAKLWPVRQKAPDVLAPYLDSVADANPGEALTHYPGSPLVALCLMRRDDKLAVMEKHPAEIRFLRQNLKSFHQASVHDRDAYESLTGLLPPAEKRGLVLIDPSYEDKDEYAAMPQKLAAALKRWPQGIFVIWYPVLPSNHHEKLVSGLATIEGATILNSRLDLKASPMALSGSGVAIINPPWKLDEEITQACDWLAKTLGGKHALVLVGKG